MDKRICVYPAGEADFASNGMGCISPTSCKVHWAMDGEYEAEIEHPIDLGAAPEFSIQPSAVSGGA